MVQFKTRTKKEREIRNGYILATTGLFVFFPAAYFWVKDLMPKGGS